MRRIVMAHGGTGSTPDQKDGTDRAVEAGMKALRAEGPLAAVVAACVVLENDERFNAGTGSNFLFDGETIMMDAAVMDSRNRYGAVAGIQRVRNPIVVARALMPAPNNILGGEGATAFARALGLPEHDPGTERARRKWQEAIQAIQEGRSDDAHNEWDLELLRSYWNFDRPFEDVFGKDLPPRTGTGGRGARGSDTIGAVATDGRTFAAAGSTGGTMTTLRGRIGDTPILGAGIYAGEFGAIAASGNGDHLIRDRAATKLHEWLGQGLSPTAVLRRFAATRPPPVDVFAVVIGLEGHAGSGNRDVAWSVRED